MATIRCAKAKPAGHRRHGPQTKSIMTNRSHYPQSSSKAFASGRDTWRRALLAFSLCSRAFYSQSTIGQASRQVSPNFVDVTRKAGIDFHLTCGTKEKLYIMDAL